MKPILSVGDKEGPRLIDSRLRTLRPDPEGEVKAAKIILEKIRTELQTLAPFKTAEIKMAGSLMKNTMITSRKEIDIIVSLPIPTQNYPPTNQSKINLQYLISDYYKVKRPEINQQNVPITKDGWKVDILPTFKISIEDFLKKSSQERQIYRPHMSLKHIEFIQERKQNCQELCRLAKFWTNGPEYIKDRYPYSSSWFIELIAIKVFDESDKDQSLEILFENFLRRVKNMNRNKSYIAFSKYYNKEDYREKYKGKLAIIEPTNPDDNLAERGAQKNHLSDLSSRAKQTLKLWEKHKKFTPVFDAYFSRDPI